jgi:hypothetical protein
MVGDSGKRIGALYESGAGRWGGCLGAILGIAIEAAASHALPNRYRPAQSSVILAFMRRSGDVTNGLTGCWPQCSGRSPSLSMSLGAASKPVDPALPLQPTRRQAGEPYAIGGWWPSGEHAAQPAAATP